MKRPSRAAHPCGLDFGTSNSTLGTLTEAGARLVPLEGDHTTIPSAVFYGAEADTRFLIGRAAIATYVEDSPGRLMRALKSILGSSIIDEQTQIYRRRIAFSDVIRAYVAALKARAEEALGAPIDAVVHGRPVHFVDNNDEADRDAENTLHQIALAAGFKHVSFQYEPIAAAYDFERQIDRDHVALIADIGGGTSDFTVVRLSPSRRGRPDRASDLLATGGLRLGGTDFDRALSMATFMPLLGYRSLQKRGDIDVPAGPYWDLSTWSDVHHLYDPKRMTELRAIRHAAAEPHLIDRLIHIIEHRRGHSMLMSAEAAKIALSDAASTTTDLGWIEPALKATATRTGFEAATQRPYDRLHQAARDCVRLAGLQPHQITTVFFTGGTSSIPHVRRAILTAFPDTPVVDGDRFGSVGLGLAIEAGVRYG